MAAKVLGSCGSLSHRTVSTDIQTLAEWRQQRKELLYLVLHWECKNCYFRFLNVYSCSMITLLVAFFQCFQLHRVVFVDFIEP